MGDLNSISLSVEGMTCASCVGRVERGLSSLPGLSDVAVNLATETARFSIGSPEQILDAKSKLDELGYPARTTDVTLSIEFDDLRLLRRTGGQSTGRRSRCARRKRQSGNRNRKNNIP